MFLHGTSVYIDSIDEFKRPILAQMIIAANGRVCECGQQGYQDLVDNGKVDVCVRNLSLRAPSWSDDGVVSMDVYCLGKILERTGVGANFTESIIQHAQARMDALVDEAAANLDRQIGSAISNKEGMEALHRQWQDLASAAGAEARDNAKSFGECVRGAGEAAGRWREVGGLTAPLSKVQGRYVQAKQREEMSRQLSRDCQAHVAVLEGLRDMLKQPTPLLWKIGMDMYGISEVIGNTLFQASQMREELEFAQAMSPLNSSWFLLTSNASLGEGSHKDDAGKKNRSSSAGRLSKAERVAREKAAMGELPDQQHDRGRRTSLDEVVVAKDRSVSTGRMNKEQRVAQEKAAMAMARGEDLEEHVREADRQHKNSTEITAELSASKKACTGEAVSPDAKKQKNKQDRIVRELTAMALARGEDPEEAFRKFEAKEAERVMQRKRDERARKTEEAKIQSQLKKAERIAAEKAAMAMAIGGSALGPETPTASSTSAPSSSLGAASPSSANADIKSVGKGTTKLSKAQRIALERAVMNGKGVPSSKESAS